MKHLLPTWATALALTSTLLLTGCDKKSDVDPSIAGIAVANPSFSMLEDAAIRGGVVEVLSNKNPNDPQGNYTVFAPNNDAFARLGLNRAADLAVLDRDFLTGTLYYHVTGGILASSDLRPTTSSPSAFGPSRRIVVRDGATYVNGSRILATDVRASNGTVHVIDKVLLATKGNIVESAVALSQGKVFVQPELTFLVAAVQYCPSVGAILSGTGPFTVFAPSDQAFRDLLVQLLGPGNYSPDDIQRLPRATVETVLKHHALGGARFTSELPANASVPTASGSNLSLGAFDNGVLTVRGNATATPANMLIPDVQCTNGVVHVIDRVLLP